MSIVLHNSLLPVQRYSALEPELPPAFEVFDFLSQLFSVHLSALSEDDTVCELFLMGRCGFTLYPFLPLPRVSAETIAVAAV